MKNIQELISFIITEIKECPDELLEAQHGITIMRLENILRIIEGVRK